MSPPPPPSSTTIVLEAECGDLDHCAFTNDGECDDGGPGWKYFQCERFSDATDCLTNCAAAAAPPPPPCHASVWASRAVASSAASAQHLPAEAIGLMACTRSKLNFAPPSPAAPFGTPATHD